MTPSPISTRQHLVLLVGRILLGWIFFDSGFRKLIAMEPFIASLERRGVPFAAFLGWIGAPLEFFGGTALLFGAWARWGALGLIVFTVAATLISHRYWDIADVAARRLQQVQFAKNITIIGGLMAMLVAGAGRFSVDGWRQRS
jgi:putative oxidoreductase